VSDYVTPRYRIEVDEDACGNAVLCLKCVRACLDEGHNVLGFVNKEVPETGERAPRSLQEIDHKIISAFLVNCNGCGQCVSVCPNNALSLVAPEPQLPRAVVPKEPSTVMCYTLADGTVIEPD
jgi:ferredoxin